MTKINTRLTSYFQKNINRFINSRLVTASVSYSRKLVIPGFDGMPLYDVAVFFVKGLQKGALSMRAAAFSYNFFLALFPAIIFFFTIIPYIPIAGFQDQLLALMQDFIPKKAYEAVQETLFDIVKRPHSGLLSVGFIMAVYFSTNGLYGASSCWSFDPGYIVLATSF